MITKGYYCVFALISKSCSLEYIGEMKAAGVLLLYKARVTQDICIEVITPLSHSLLPAPLLPPFTPRRNFTLA